MGHVYLESIYPIGPVLFFSSRAAALSAMQTTGVAQEKGIMTGRAGNKLHCSPVQFHLPWLTCACVHNNFQHSSIGILILLSQNKP